MGIGLLAAAGAALLVWVTAPFRRRWDKVERREGGQ